jgi:hypothetical protein
MITLPISTIGIDLHSSRERISFPESLSTFPPLISSLFLTSHPEPLCDDEERDKLTEIFKSSYRFGSPSHIPSNCSFLRSNRSLVLMLGRRAIKICNTSMLQFTSLRTRSRKLREIEDSRKLKVIDSAQSSES